MTEQAKTTPDTTWPKGWYRFPLKPKFTVRQADRQNTFKWNFHWMAFRAWSMDSVTISAEISLEDDFMVRIQLPYLIVGIFIPIFPYYFLHKFWRKAQWYYEISELKENECAIRGNK